MKIYTRTGDDGTTGLLGAGRVPKHDARVEAYGSVDELNAALGVARAADRKRWFAELLPRLQASLFQLGGELAAPDPAAIATLARLDDADVVALERAIDGLERDLPPLTKFVLPGGTPLAASLHLARTVCRRAERRVTARAAARAGAAGGVEPRLVRYLNRLADLLFVMARWSNHRAGAPESVWSGGARGAPAAARARTPAAGRGRSGRRGPT